MKETMRKREEKIRAFHRMTAEEDLWGIYEFCQRDRRLTVLWKDMCEYASVYHRHAVRPLARKFKEGRMISEAEKTFYLYLQAEFLRRQQMLRKQLAKKGKEMKAVYASTLANKFC